MFTSSLWTVLLQMAFHSKSWTYQTWVDVTIRTVSDIVNTYLLEHFVAKIMFQNRLAAFAPVTKDGVISQRTKVV